MIEAWKVDLALGWVSTIKPDHEGHRVRYPVPQEVMHRPCLSAKPKAPEMETVEFEACQL